MDDFDVLTIFDDENKTGPIYDKSWFAQCQDVIDLPVDDDFWTNEPEFEKE